MASDTQVKIFHVCLPGATFNYGYWADYIANNTIVTGATAYASVLIGTFTLSDIQEESRKWDETPEAEQTEVALAFGSAIFGDEQSHKLFEFYDNSPLAMITACGMYFQGNLSKKITKAQKRKGNTGFGQSFFCAEPGYGTHCKQNSGKAHICIKYKKITCKKKDVNL